MSKKMISALVMGCFVATTGLAMAGGAAEKKPAAEATKPAATETTKPEATAPTKPAEAAAPAAPAKPAKKKIEGC